MSMKKAIGYGFGGCLGVGLAMVLVGGCIVAISPGGQRSRGAGQAESTAAATMEKFNQIQQGMPLHSLNAIMGGPGETISENVIGAGTQFATASAMYGWKAPRGFGGIHVMVQNGAVMSKTQVGL